VAPPAWLDAHGGALGRLPERQRQRLATGSWIDGHFGTWIGDPANNAAWDALTLARRTVGAQCCATLAGELSGTPEEVAAARRANDCLLLAEASDWFWWFGKGHTSLEDAEFDSLFRRHLRAAYGFLGLRAPPGLEVPIDPANRSEANPTACGSALALPTGIISPRITGRVESDCKWIGAGRHDLEQGALHQADPSLKRLYFGFGPNGQGGRRIYRRVDGARPVAEILAEPGARLIVLMARPQPIRNVIEAQGRTARVHLEEPDGGAAQCDGTCKAAAGSGLELSVPLACVAPGVETTGRGEIEVCVQVEVGGRGVERLPRDRNVTFHVDVEALECENRRVWRQGEGA